MNRMEDVEGEATMIPENQDPGRLTGDEDETVLLRPMEMETGDVDTLPATPLTPAPGLRTMQQMFERQSRILTTFIQQQTTFNQTVMEALGTGLSPGRRTTTTGTASTGTETGQVFDVDSVNERAPERSQSLSFRGARDEWKQVAVALANKPYAMSIDKPSFRGPNTKHPIVFLNRFERYFKSLKLPEGEKLEAVKDCLTGAASEWSETLQSSWITYDDFKKAFTQLFWSEDRQFAERVRLGNMKYLSERSMTMTGYFLRQISSYRLFDPPLSETLILTEILRQYPPNIQSLWAVVPNRTIVSALEFFERQEIIAGKRFRPESTTTQPTVAVVQNAQTNQPRHHNRTWHNTTRLSDLDFSVPPPLVPARKCNCQERSGSASEN